MFSEILERFIKDSAVAVMVRALLENLLNADKIDRWFEGVRQTQYTKEILFSSIVGLMLQVVCKIRPSVHCAYPHSGITASVVAVYDKLKNLEQTTAQGLGSSYCRRSGNHYHSHRRDEPTVTRRLSGQVFRW